jgi:hypothetical protein
MSSYGSVEQFLGDDSFDEYQSEIRELSYGYCDVRLDGEDLVFFTTDKGVWWSHGLEMRETFPNRMEGVWLQLCAWIEMAKGKVPDYMDAWREPSSSADRKLLLRWQSEATQRGT